MNKRVKDRKRDIIFNEINVKNRWYYISKVQDPIMRKVLKLAAKFPKATRENTIKPNSHVLMDIFDWMLGQEENPSLKALMIILRNTIISKNEASNLYSERIDVFVEKLVEKYSSGEWRKRRPWTPSQYWSEASVIEERVKLIHNLEDENLLGRTA